MKKYTLLCTGVFVLFTTQSIQRVATRVIRLPQRFQPGALERAAAASRALSTLPPKVEQEHQGAQSSGYKKFGYAAATAAAATGLGWADYYSKKDKAEQEVEIKRFESELDSFISKHELKYARPYITEYTKEKLEELFSRFDDLIKDSRYRVIILNFLKKLLSSSMDTKKRHAIMNAFNKKQHSAIFKYLQENQFEYKAELKLLRKNQKELDATIKFKKVLERYNPESPESNALSQLHFSKLIKNSMTEDVLRYYPLQESERSFKQFQEAIKGETWFLNRGYICLYHGQGNAFALMSDLTTKLLYLLAQEKQPDDFLFLRLREKDFEKIGKPTKNLDAEVLNEQVKLMKGPSETVSTWEENKARDNVLSLNLFAYGNVYDLGSSTFRYVENGYNIVQFDPMMFYKNLKILGISKKIIDECKEKFEALKRDTENAYITSRLMLIAIPANIIDESVYTVIYQKKRDMRTPLTISGKKISHMSELIESLYTQPSTISLYDIDPFECAMPLTPALALNPHSGIKIFKFDNPVSKKAERELEKAKQEFVDGVINRLKENGEFEKIQKRAKDYFAFLKDVHEAEERRLQE